jgi:hypothetical protein
MYIPKNSSKCCKLTRRLVYINITTNLFDAVKAI